MSRIFFLLGMTLFLSVSSVCQRVNSPIIVHVLHDPSAPFATKVMQAGRQFALARLHVGSGKEIIVATNADGFSSLLRRVQDTREEMLILKSSSDPPEITTVKDHVGKPRSVCGGASAYIPDWVSGEARQASEMYLQFLVDHCQDSVRS